MKTTERPILFSGPMVRAILEGRKTQTRRVVKDLFDTKGGQFCVEYADTDPNVLVHVHNPKCEGYCDYTCHYPCPYGQVGDRLWVRETWACLNSKVRPGSCIVYRADTPDGERVRCDAPWRPSIHMPRWASRITLEIVNVRVERLQSISEEDAIAEGMQKSIGGLWCGAPHKAHGLPRQHNTALIAFADFWDSINASRGYEWFTNKWVWVVSFKVVQP